MKNQQIDTKKKVSNSPNIEKKISASAILVAITVCAYNILYEASSAFGQDGNAGIEAATTQVKGYFVAGTNLMYAIGALVGIIGAIKVFNKWNAGEPDTNKVAAAWFGSCVFLVVVATVLKSFFGV